MNKISLKTQILNEKGKWWKVFTTPAVAFNFKLFSTFIKSQCLMPPRDWQLEAEMESRAAKRRANQSQNEPLTKRRVVLGELSNLPNLILPQPAVTDKTLTVHNGVSAESNVNAPIVSDIYNYLRTIEVTCLVLCFSLLFVCVSNCTDSDLIHLVS